MIDKVLLFPYYIVLALRNAYYNKRSAELFVADVPTLSVGNVTVGGTGKTPQVEMILDLLSKSEKWSGKQLAVLSRGYKRESKGFQQLSCDGSASCFGDEPMQIKRKYPEVVVAVDRDRIEGCKLLCDPSQLQTVAPNCLHPEFAPADYIVLDDAFQFRKLRAHKSIVLVSYKRPVHKDMLLPLGRLRDLAKRVFDADAVIISKCPAYIDIASKESFLLDMGYRSYNAETCKAVNDKGREQWVFFSTIEYQALKPVFSCTDSRYNYAKKAIMLTGIANDMPLRRYLSDSYKIVKCFSLPDHHSFVRSDIQKVKTALKHSPTAAIVTTEKDAQRLRDVEDMPSEISERLLYAPIATRFCSDTELNVFKKFIE